jgi:hypothetical protein
VEVQDGKRRADGIGRGALHQHFILVTDKSVDVEWLHGQALLAGFGCVMDIDPVERGRTSPGYLCKYVSKGCASTNEIPWVAVDDDGVTLKDDPYKPTYRTYSQSANWRCTMAEVIDVARAAANRHAATLAATPVDESSVGSELLDPALVPTPD